MAKYHVLSEEGDVSFIADVDMTAQQYRWVGPASAYDRVASTGGASNPAPFGVLQNSPSLGQEARVRMSGFSKVWVNQPACLLQWARFVTVASDGRTESLAISGSWATGRCVGAASSAGASMYSEIFIFGGGLSVCPVSSS